MQSQMIINTKQTLGRTDWLVAALELLKTQGIDHVKVEPLAAHLGVTKGSFYWHFKDRQALLNAVLAYWAIRQTGIIISHVSHAGDTARDKIIALMKFLTIEEPHRYDSSIRAWAQFDKKVAKVVEKIDKKRLDFISKLFQSAGFVKTEAEYRAHAVYYYQVGENSVSLPVSKDQRLGWARQLSEMLLRR